MTPGLAGAMITLGIILPAVLNGVTTGAVYALVALGLTLIYGVLHIINFAHGALLMLALNSSRISVPRLIPAMLAVFFIVFMVLRVTPGMALDGMAYHYWPPWTSEALGFPKAGGLRTGGYALQFVSAP